MMKVKLNAKEMGEITWVSCVLVAMICFTALGFVSLQECLGFVFVMLWGLWNLYEAHCERAKAGLRQAQAEAELFLMKERLDEAERLLAEFYEELGIEEITRINYRAYKNKYLR